MAKLLNSVPAISAVWKSAKFEGTNAYQKIIKHNSKYISPEGITKENIITPPGFFASAKEIILDENSIVLKCIVGKEFSVPHAVAYILLVLNSKTNEELFILSSDKITIIDKEFVEVNFSISKNERKKLYSSKRAMVLASLISMIPQIKWTSTISFEVNPFDNGIGKTSL